MLRANWILGPATHASALVNSAMENVSHILWEIERGNSTAAEHLLPLVYEELRALAAQRLAREKPGQSLQATALVHDAYVRLVDKERAQHWNNRGHFFAAAAEAMRRILIERARRKKRIRHGGGHQRVDLDVELCVADEVDEQLLQIDDALRRLAAHDPEAAHVVKLRYFAGLTIAETADVMNLSVRTANRRWNFARAWLFDQLREVSPEGPEKKEP